MTQKTIRIYGREYTAKNGNNFVRYSFTPDGKVFYVIKFCKDCKMIPNKAGYVQLTLDKDTCTIQHGKVLADNKKENDTIWVHNVIDYQIDVEANKEIEENKKKALDKVFG